MAVHGRFLKNNTSCSGINNKDRSPMDVVLLNHSIERRNEQSVLTSIKKIPIFKLSRDCYVIDINVASDAAAAIKTTML